MAIGSTKTQAGEPETLIGVIPSNARDLGSCPHRQAVSASKYSDPLVPRDDKLFTDAGFGLSAAQLLQLTLRLRLHHGKLLLLFTQILNYE